MRSDPKSSASVLANWLYALAALLLLGAGTAWLVQSPYFSVRHLRIEPAQGGAFRHISSSSLIAARDDSIVGNIFQINLNHVKNRFEQIDWVAKVEVSRAGLDTVVVRVFERVPVARWSESELVDKNGTVFTAQSDGFLPIFVGTSGSAPEMAAVYARINPLLADARISVTKLIYSSRSSWKLELSNRVTVKLGRDDVEERMRRFVQHWDSVLKPQEGRIVYVDMRYPSGFAVKFKDGSEL